MDVKTASHPALLRGISRRGRARFLGIFLPAIIILFALLAPPWSILEKAHLVGFGICHQLPEHSFQPGGVTLPLCARDSGTFLGALLAFASVAIMGRLRASRLAPPSVLAVLVAFFLFWVLDGLNSFAGSFAGLPSLYPPSNLLRMISGTLNGLALGLLLHTVANMTLWREPDARPNVPDWGAFAVILVAAGGLILVAASAAPITLYPLAILSALAVLLILALLNGLIIALALRRENALERTWAAAMPFLLWGGVFGIAQLAAIGLLRAWLTSGLGVPL